jgi:tripartite-type tricarboxylate transporter receptor subunit TctC
LLDRFRPAGKAAAMWAIMAGRIDRMALPAGGAEGPTRDGKSRAVAVIAERPLEIIPGAPLVKDHGVDLASGLWKAICAPARAPPAVIGRLAWGEVVRATGAHVG